MTDEKYTYHTYGLGRVYDAELGAWREPMTAAEVEVARRMSEHLKQSFAETTDVPNKSQGC